MKLILLLFISLFLSATFVSPSHQEQEPPELKEATELTNSAIKLFNQQKFDEALPLAKRALQIREKLLPRADPRVSRSLLNLGDLYIVKRDYNAAKPIFERLLSILEERFGPTDSNLAATLDRLAAIYHRLGNMNKAENMYQRAVAVREKAFGPDNVTVVEPLFLLAQFYRFRKDVDRALPSYMRVLSIYKKIAAVNTAGFERARNGLYCLSYENQNPAIHKAIEEFQKQSDPSAPQTDPPQIINGKAIELGRPEYPQGARERGLSGTVWVLVMIDEAGKVISASDMCQGPPYLSESAVRAAFKSRFTPTKLSGMPVKVKGLIQYKFVNEGTRFIN